MRSAIYDGGNGPGPRMRSAIYGAGLVPRMRRAHLLLLKFVTVSDKDIAKQRSRWSNLLLFRGGHWF